MKSYPKIHLAGLILAGILLLFVPIPAMAGEVTLIGEVNDNYQLVADGQIYEIADTPKGNEMAENFISAKVKVTGTMEEKNEIKTITVKNFQVMPE